MEATGTEVMKIRKSTVIRAPNFGATRAYRQIRQKPPNLSVFPNFLSILKQTTYSGLYFFLFRKYSFNKIREKQEIRVLCVFILSLMQESLKWGRSFTVACPIVVQFAIIKLVMAGLDEHSSRGDYSKKTAKDKQAAQHDFKIETGGSSSDRVVDCGQQRYAEKGGALHHFTKVKFKECVFEETLFKAREQNEPEPAEWTWENVYEKFSKRSCFDSIFSGTFGSRVFFLIYKRLFLKREMGNSNSTLSDQMIFENGTVRDFIV